MHTTKPAIKYHRRFYKVKKRLFLDYFDCHANSCKFLKKFDKSIHIHYNVFVAKKGLLTALKYCGRMVTRQLKTAYHAKRGCSLVVKLQPSKLMLWVRFPSPAPFFCPKRLSVTQDVKNLAIPTQKAVFIFSKN